MSEPKEEKIIYGLSPDKLPQERPSYISNHNPHYKNGVKKSTEQIVKERLNKRPKRRTAGSISYKQENFCKELIKTKDPVQAALKIYNTKDRDTATQIATQNLQKPHLKNRINELLDSKGLKLEYSLEQLKQLHTANKLIVVDKDTIEAPDNPTRLGAVNTALKLHGVLDTQQQQQAPQVSITIDMTQLESVVDKVNKLNDMLGLSRRQTGEVIDI